MPITLINGHIQNAQATNITPNGWMELTLNVDATLIASPFGQVLAASPIRVYFDSVSDVVSGTTLYSNAELNPQTIINTAPAYGTWYYVNFYDRNGTPLNKSPQKWQFTQAANSTVDIGTMVASNVSTIYYPTPVGNSVILVTGAGIATGSITSTGAITVLGSGNTTTAVTAGTSIAAAPNGDIIVADGSGNVKDSGTLLSSLGSPPWNTITNAAGSLTLANGTNATTFNQTAATNWTWANTTTGTVSTTNASPVFNLLANAFTGSASIVDTWQIGTTLAVGTNGATTLFINHAHNTGSTGQQVIQLGNVNDNPPLIFFPSANFPNLSGTQGNGCITCGNGAPYLSGGNDSGITFGYGQGTIIYGFYNGGILVQRNDGVIGWSSSTLTSAMSQSDDTGLSRSAAGVVAIGNGSQGDVSGSLATNSIALSGFVTKYNNIALVGDGVPSQVATVDLLGKTSTQAGTLYTPTSSGWFRITCRAKMTTTGSTPTLGPLTIGYTDGDAVAQSQVFAFINQSGAVATTSTVNTTTGATLSGSMEIYAATTVAITYSFAISGTIGAGQYSMRFRVEAL